MVFLKLYFNYINKNIKQYNIVTNAINVLHKNKTIFYCGIINRQQIIKIASFYKCNH